MGRYTIAFGSVTLAMKAQSLLNAYGIRASVIRTPKNLTAGCGYSLTGFGDISAAADILDRGGVRYKAIMELA